MHHPLRRKLYQISFFYFFETSTLTYTQYTQLGSCMNMFWFPKKEDTWLSFEILKKSLLPGTRTNIPCCFKWAQSLFLTLRSMRPHRFVFAPRSTLGINCIKSRCIQDTVKTLRFLDTNEPVVNVKSGLLQAKEDIWTQMFLAHSLSRIVSLCKFAKGGKNGNMELPTKNHANDIWFAHTHTHTQTHTPAVREHPRY